MQLAFASFDAYPLLDPAVREGIGGAEVRAVTFARGLRDRHRANISFIVNDRRGLKSTAEGFQLRGYTKRRLGAVAKLTHSLTKRLSQRPPGNSYFRDLDTDVVLCFGVRNDTASIVRSTKDSGKKCVVFLTSDRNVEDAMRYGRKDRGIYGELGHWCRYTLEHADLVVVQSPYQRDRLQQELGLASSLIRNPIDLLQRASAATAAQPTVLWVGRADTYSKRADVCLELAQHCPDIRFRMVMNNHDPRTFAELKKLAPSNVEIVEQVPFSEIEDLFCQSHLLINTSAAEGFPNSFLQAAKYGKPIVSLDVDPGNMLTEHGCGVCARGNLEQMAEVVRGLIADRMRYAESSQRAAQYVAAYHDAADRCDELFEALATMTQPRLKSVA